MDAGCRQRAFRTVFSSAAGHARAATIKSFVAGYSFDVEVGA
jgi:hypothetical protein